MIIIAALLAVGGVTALTVRFAGNFRGGGTRKERGEIVRLWEQGSYEEVYTVCGGALESRPVDYFLLTMHGFSAYQLGISQINSQNAAGYFESCVTSLRQAMQLKAAANDGRLYYVLGKAYSYMGDSFADLTVRYLEKARELSYTAADISEYLGMAYASIGDYRSSVAAFSRALGTPGQGEGSQSSLLLFSIARSYAALEDYDNARAYLVRCVEVSPDSRTVLSALLLLSEVLTKSDDIEGAKKALLTILEQSGENAEAHYRLGELYSLQGDAVRARAEWRLALRADPAHPGARTRFSM